MGQGAPSDWCSGTGKPEVCGGATGWGAPAVAQAPGTQGETPLAANDTDGRHPRLGHPLAPEPWASRAGPASLPDRAGPASVALLVCGP